MILIMAMGLEWFRFKERIRQQELIQNFITLLWLVGALSAAITVVMGILLSKEPGYEGSTLELHKWFGASVVLISSAIVWCRNASWYSIRVARSASLASALGLVVAGHFGADLTHGANFVLQPVLKPSKEDISIEQALVFSDVILPIFENKCTSCHNADKQKGGLMLVDEKSILKGGRTGKLFETGQPQVSLLLRRIHLPDGEKEHMPPKGKPQLTEDEAQLLYLWIKEKVDFKKKVIDLPLNDSLRQLSAAILKPAGNTGDEYAFAAADEKLIKKLNTNYRSVSAMGKESPALGVNIYNRKNYDHKVLEELSPIQKQIVSLYLDHMPVKDAELKDIAKFENLRSLNLNFTDITGTTLKELAVLKHLKSLSLSGTRLSPDAAKQLGLLKNVENVVLWNCGLKADEISKLKQTNKNINYTEGFKDDGKPIKLNFPQLKTPLVFSNALLLQLSHPINGVEMRYTTDGSQPDSVSSPLYKPGIVCSQDNISLKVRAYKAGWLSSDVAQFEFHKSTYTPDSISFLTFPSFQSSPQRARSLIDKDLGSGFIADGKWIGSQKDLALYVQFARPANLKSITINSLRDNLPGEIEIWNDVNNADTKLLCRMTPKRSPDPNSGVTRSIECKLPKACLASSLKIVFKPAGRTSQPGKINQTPYFFVDEIFFN
ncbi:c-type cytochrome domain-containing protein [Flavitalea sp. BT771]|nr:c-type cytochrome domain-containing protein [Flavitalea sp. BT771]